MVNVPKAVADYLRGVPGVPRVVHKTPENQSTAWVRLVQLDARSASQPIDHLIRYLLQLDCYAGEEGGYPEARDLSNTVRTALKAMPGTHGDVVVTGAECVGHRFIPDPDFTPDRDRFALTFYLWAHER